MAVALALVASACGTDDLTRSCDGQFVGACRPFELAVITEAAFTPQLLPVGDFAQRAQITVAFDRCEMAPRRPIVVLSARIPNPEEPGEERIIPLLDLEDDGTNGDPVADDDVIDVDVANPFIANVPPNTELTLRFVPRSGVGGCAGEAVELPYRTGPRFEP
ncbi:MAG: hypothetical protein ACFCGT_16420 [Sandaracinaceae bacterium]